MAKRTYTEQQKREATGYALVAGDKRAAIAYRIPERTINDWRHGPIGEQARDQVAAEFKDDVGRGMRLALDKMIELVQRPDAVLRDVNATTGILIDKYLLLSGRATSRTESRNVNVNIDPFRDLPEAEKHVLREWLDSVVTSTDEELLEYIGSTTEELSKILSAKQLPPGPSPEEPTDVG